LGKRSKSQPVMKKNHFEDWILFENEDIVVINKPPYLSTLDERNDQTVDSLLRLARIYTPDAQVAHRLDKETSGVLAIAKNPEAYRHLSMQFEHREILKRYQAVVGGLHEFDQISVYLPIYVTREGLARIDREKGKEAETVFTTAKVYKKHSLIDCYPITGRLHQIRVHLQCLKAPIVQDEAYGGKPIFLSEIKAKNFNLKKDTQEQPLIKRVALHAYELSFRLLNDKEVTVQAPYPKDFEALISQLEKHNN
jgi:23S rRNA pseudouridine955/2504/2580 synthase